MLVSGFTLENFTISFFVIYSLPCRYYTKAPLRIVLMNEIIYHNFQILYIHQETSCPMSEVLPHLSDIRWVESYLSGIPPTTVLFCCMHYLCGVIIFSSDVDNFTRKYPLV